MTTRTYRGLILAPIGPDDLDQLPGDVRRELWSRLRDFRGVAKFDRVQTNATYILQLQASVLLRGIALHVPGMPVEEDDCTLFEGGSIEQAVARLNEQLRG